MNFGIADLEAHWGKRGSSSPYGGPLSADYPKEFACRDIAPTTHTGLLGGNGCKRSPRDPRRPYESGCFACPLPDAEMCDWDVSQGG